MATNSISFIAFVMMNKIKLAIFVAVVVLCGNTMANSCGCGGDDDKSDKNFNNKNDFQYKVVDMKGSCPRIRYIENFSMPRVVGWHYAAFSSIDNPLCYANEGQTIYAAQFDATTITAQFCCRSAANPNEAFCGNTVGSGTIIPTNRPGVFTYYTKTDLDKIEVQVLYTDYDDLTIVYGCRPSPCGCPTKRQELILVLSRNYKLSSASETTARNVLERNDIKFSNAKPVKQGPSMPYTPNSNSCNRRPF